MLAHRRDEDLLGELEERLVERAAHEARPLDEVGPDVEERRVLGGRPADLGRERLRLLLEARPAHREVGLDVRGAELREPVRDAHHDDPAAGERAVAERRAARSRPRRDCIGTTRPSRSATTEWTGRIQSGAPSPQRIMRGNVIFSTSGGRISAITSDAARPGTTFRATTYGALRELDDREVVHGDALRLREPLGGPRGPALGVEPPGRPAAP